MYINEFILVVIWTYTLLYKVEVEVEDEYHWKMHWFIYTRNKGMRYVRNALRSQLTSED